MNILYIGDVMAKPGREIVKRILPGLRKELAVDFVIAQAENSNDLGKGPGKNEIAELQQAGADFFSGGNHSLRGEHSKELYNDAAAPIVRPANLIGSAGSGWKIVPTKAGNVLVVSMLGQTVGKELQIRNPLHEIDSILEQTKDQDIVARIVNFHGDYSSEKRVFGYYLDGRFSAVLGDHWHVPTADAMVLPKGTAHITDVGMCGTLHSSLGVKIDVIAQRWSSGKPSKNAIEENGPLQFNAVLIDVDTTTGLSSSITQIQRIID
ncbi:MAG: YmdB family metallophosphoesterase [Candidatus Saccharimonadales bacterium]